MTDLTPEQKKLQDKIRYILFELSLEGIDPDYTNTTEQILSLIQEERIDELETTVDKWNDTDLRGFIEYASDRLQALKQERKNE